MHAIHLFELSWSLPSVSCGIAKKEIVITTLKLHILKILRILKGHAGYRCNILSCISGVDFFDKIQRFLVSYDLLSLALSIRIRIKLYTNEAQYVISSFSVFVNSNWWEREIWDLFGLFFDKHPDMRRILTDYGFEGYPMRKDFPLFGYIEVYYNESKKRVVSDRVQLTQEHRNFASEISW